MHNILTCDIQAGTRNILYYIQYIYIPIPYTKYIICYKVILVLEQI